MHQGRLFKLKRSKRMSESFSQVIATKISPRQLQGRVLATSNKCYKKELLPHIFVNQTQKEDKYREKIETTKS